MPTHNKKPFEPSPNPPTATATDEVFQLWPTGEIFTDYHAYIDALWAQRAAQWTCTVTGKTGLTLPEALASEEAALASLQEMPAPWRRLSATTIHHSLHSLNHASSLVYEQAKAGLFLEGEEVSVELGGERVYGRILKILPSLDSGAEVVKLALYKDEQFQEWMGEGTVIGLTCLTRVGGKQRAITKALVKRYMRSIAHRDNPFLPWIVKEKAVREEFGLAEELPEEMRNALAVAAADRPSKRKREQSVDQMAEEQVVPEQVVPELEFPIEDLLIPPEHYCPFVIDEPVGTDIYSEYPKLEPKDLFADSLAIWSFLNSFAKSLNLSPFSFADWVAAICHDSCCDLVEEAVFVLFEHVCKKRRNLSKEDFCAFISRVFTYYPSVDGHQNDDLQVSKRFVKWFESGSWRSLGMVGCLCGFVEEVAVTMAEEFEVDFASWTALAAHLKTLKRGDQMDVSDFIFLVNFLMTSFVIEHQSDLKAAVDAEVDRADSLRDKIKDIVVEESQLSQEITVMEQQLIDTTALPEDSKERRKVESNLRKARQNQQLLEKKRDTWERDIRKAGWAHRCERLGLDRHHRQYWWLDGWRAVGATHQSCGKLLIEVAIDDTKSTWRFIDAPDDLEKLLLSLNEKGIREGRLKRSLLELRDHMSACFTPRRPDDDATEHEEKRRGGVRKSEPSFLRYKNKL